MFITIQEMKITPKGELYETSIRKETIIECDEYTKEYDNDNSLQLNLLRGGLICRKYIFEESRKDGKKSQINIYVGNNKGDTVASF